MIQLLVFFERYIMIISYKKLLIDKEMNKQDLRKMAHVSSATIARMTRGESVTTETLRKICEALGCDTVDIMEFIDADTSKS